MVVITDRVVLDRQLQETIYQFEHARGVVVKIDKDSSQLAEALAGEQARIIITTLQKFPFVLDKIGELPAPPLRGDRRRGALLPDRRGGQGPAAGARGDRGAGADGRRGRGRRVHRRGRSTRSRRRWPRPSARAGPAVEPVVLRLHRHAEGPHAGDVRHLQRRDRASTSRSTSTRCARRSRRASSSTCSPTTRPTRPSGGSRRRSQDDPEYDASEGAAGDRPVRVACTPTTSRRRPRSSSSTSASTPRKKIGGLAKAMVVTSSRLHAVRYKQAIDTYIARARATATSGTLVAFSGKVDRRHGHAATPSRSMNGFPESPDGRGVRGRRLPGADRGREVPDRLRPAAAAHDVRRQDAGRAGGVQTLSRLNRIHPLKEDTFVLDFRNDTEDIVEAFEPYYGRTVAPPTDPNLLWDTRRRLDDFDVLRPEEIEAAMPALLGAGASDEKRSAETYAALDPAQGALRGSWTTSDRLEFRDALDKFVRTYSFVSQIVAFTDPKLERDYVYCRALVALPARHRHRRAARPRHRGRADPPPPPDDLQRHAVADLGDGRGAVVLRRGQGQPAGARPGAPLQIVEVLNERFGTDLTDVDKLLFDQFEETWVADGELSRPGPEQHASRTSGSSSTASSCRPSSPAWTPTTRSSRRSSTTTTSAPRSASSTCARSTSGCAKAPEPRAQRSRDSAQR